MYTYYHKDLRVFILRDSERPWRSTGRKNERGWSHGREGSENNNSRLQSGWVCGWELWVFPFCYNAVGFSWVFWVAFAHESCCVFLLSGNSHLTFFRNSGRITRALPLLFCGPVSEESRPRLVQWVLGMPTGVQNSGFSGSWAQKEQWYRPLNNAPFIKMVSIGMERLIKWLKISAPEITEMKHSTLNRVCSKSVKLPGACSTLPWISVLRVSFSPHTQWPFFTFAQCCLCRPYLQNYRPRVTGVVFYYLSPLVAQ